MASWYIDTSCGNSRGRLNIITYNLQTFSCRKLPKCYPPLRRCGSTLFTKPPLGASRGATCGAETKTLLYWAKATDHRCLCHRYRKGVFSIYGQGTVTVLFVCGNKEHTFTVFGLVFVGLNASATARVILVVIKISGQSPGLFFGPV